MNPQRQCCHNAHCEHRGLYDKSNIGVHSQKDKRYICHRCGKTFAETITTPLYRKQYEHTFIAQMVSLLAYGCPVQAIVATYNLDERTVGAWQKESGEHCRRVHEAESRPLELVYPLPISHAARFGAVYEGEKCSLAINHVRTISVKRLQPSHNTFTPGKPSRLRARKPPRRAIHNTACCKVGASVGIFSPVQTTA